MKADYFMGDLYPNLAYFSTRSESIPEQADKVVLVDSSEKAQENPISVSPEKTRSIWVTVAVVFLLIVLLGVRF